MYGPIQYGKAAALFRHTLVPMFCSASLPQFLISARAGRTTSGPAPLCPSLWLWRPQRASGSSINPGRAEVIRRDAAMPSESWPPRLQPSLRLLQSKPWRRVAHPRLCYVALAPVGRHENVLVLPLSRCVSARSLPLVLPFPSSPPRLLSLTSSWLIPSLMLAPLTCASRQEAAVIVCSAKQ